MVSFVPQVLYPQVKLLGGLLEGLNVYQMKKKSLSIWIFVALIFILVYLYRIRVHGVQEVTIPTYMIGYIIFMTLPAGILNSVWWYHSCVVDAVK